MDFEERTSLRNRKVNMNMSLALPLMEVLDKIAEHERAPLAQIVTRMIRRGLEVERGERAILAASKENK